MATNQALNLNRSDSNLAGFNNLLARESRKWWSTRRWWMQALIWMAILNGFVLFSLFVVPGMLEASAELDASGTEALSVDEFKQDIPDLLFGLATLMLPVGVIILTQSQVYSEKRMGVAAWILSKPVSRTTYLLAKLIADAVGILLIMVIVPMGIAYLLLAPSIEISGTDFLTATGLLVIMLFFYQAFTLMMSVLGNSTEIVLGMSFGMLLGGVVLKGAAANVLGDIIYVTPWMLPDVITMVVDGYPLPSQMQMTIVAVPVLAILCLGIMFWQFRQQEL